MVKTFGAKITNQLSNEIKIEITKLGKTKSEFLRMLLDNYFKNQNQHKDRHVNQLTIPVNQDSKKDEYQTTKQKVDSLLNAKEKDIRKTKS